MVPTEGQPWLQPSCNINNPFLMIRLYNTKPHQITQSWKPPYAIIWHTSRLQTLNYKTFPLLLSVRYFIFDMNKCMSFVHFGRSNHARIAIRSGGVDICVQYGQGWEEALWLMSHCVGTDKIEITVLGNAQHDHSRVHAWGLNTPLWRFCVQYGQGMGRGCMIDVRLYLTDKLY